jgi:hypothetical protein
MKGPGIEQQVKALTGGELTPGMLPRYALGPATESRSFTHLTQLPDSRVDLSHQTTPRK